MTLEQIKAAVLKGQKVCWFHIGYEVHFDGRNWHIVCMHNQYTTGLTHQDGVTMNENPSDFFIASHGVETATQARRFDRLKLVMGAVEAGRSRGRLARLLSNSPLAGL